MHYNVSCCWDVNVRSTATDVRGVFSPLPRLLFISKSVTLNLSVNRSAHCSKIMYVCMKKDITKWKDNVNSLLGCSGALLWTREWTFSEFLDWPIIRFSRIALLHGARCHIHTHIFTKTHDFMYHEMFKYRYTLMHREVKEVKKQRIIFNN